MGLSRRQAVLCSFAVVVGGAILATDLLSDSTISSGEYSVSLGAYGLVFLVLGVALLAGDATGRTRVLGSAGLFIGLVFIVVVVDALVALGPYIYIAGIAVLVLTGIGLSAMHLDSSGKQSADGS